MASEAARAQIVSSIMDYWHAHPGVALSIIEKLLNYSILTPFSVIDWALVGSTPANGTNGGESLARAHVFEIVLNTVAKVTGRVRQVHASPDADADDRAKEAKNMRDMFRSTNDALASWAGGEKDQLMEGAADDDAEREQLIRRWGQRWLRVFQRKAALEESFLAEAGKVANGDGAAQEDGNANGAT